jgi:hypothetical protein
VGYAPCLCTCCGCPDGVARWGGWRSGLLMGCDGLQAWEAGSWSAILRGQQGRHGRRPWPSGGPRLRTPGVYGRMADRAGHLHDR